MAKILQIRRGTTDANNNFTGMIGEISYDTDAKTLRVHDGETLGGVTLARADQISTDNAGTTEFDITSVSDDFWRETIARCGPVLFEKYESGLMDICITTSSIEYVFNAVSDNPFLVRVVCVCQSPDAGYAVGDIVSAFGIGAHASPQPNTWVDENGLHVRIFIANQAVWVSNKTSGVATNITPENWKFQILVYC